MKKTGLAIQFQFSESANKKRIKNLAKRLMTNEVENGMINGIFHADSIHVKRNICFRTVQNSFDVFIKSGFNRQITYIFA